MLTIKQEKFVAKYVANEGNATDAYRFAFDTSRMQNATVTSRASELLKVPKIAERLALMRKELSDETKFGIADVLRLWITLATADPNELIQNRRGCCRFCHGIEHGYQWISKIELNIARAKAMDAGKELPDDSGGFGFSFENAPCATCPVCEGEGKVRVHVADTRRLSPAGKLLYAGLKTTRDGVEVKMRDQDGALQNIAKYFGMLKNKFEFSDPNGKPVAPVLTNLDPMQVSQEYQRFMGIK